LFVGFVFVVLVLLLGWCSVGRIWAGVVYGRGGWRFERFGVVGVFFFLGFCVCCGVVLGD
ncbi:hypothetical protein RA264_28415, partial [Pseudomonas syringae pv. tagetis]|uniref:hypothetical protein n=1 Tax=Pseudomonas syringae group genomosp. 7 TaxID=251699 RepID=UPI00376FFA26